MADAINMLKPSACFEVQRIIGISASDGSCKSYQVQWAPSWISGLHLVGCEHLIEQFLKQETNKGHAIKVEDSDDRSRDGVALMLDDKGDDRVMQDVNIQNDLVEQESGGSIHNSEVSKNLSVGNSTLYKSNANDSWLHSQYACTNSRDARAATKDTHMQNITFNSIHHSPDRNSTTLDCENVGKNIEDIYNSEDNCRVLILQPDENSEHTHLGGDVNFNSMLSTFTANPNAEFTGRDSEASEKIYPNAEFIGRDIEASDKTFEHSNLNRTYHNENRIVKVKVEETLNVSMDKKSYVSEESDNILRNTSYNTTFPSDRNLKNHSIVAIDSENVYPSCPFCHRKFQNAYIVQKHSQLCKARLMDVQTHSKDYPYKCTFCRKSFLGHADLVRHTRVHTGERPFECKLCEKKFKRNDHLQVHARTHFKTHAQERPSMCDNV